MSLDKTTPNMQEPAPAPGRNLRRAGLRMIRHTASVASAAALTLSLGSNIYAAVSGGDCSTWQHRRPETTEYTEEQLLRSAQEALTIWVSDMPGWAQGVAMPGVVLTQDSRRVDTWVHEHVHQMQMDADGTATFWYRYTTDFIRGKAEGCGAHDAYLSIRYEIEARKVTAALAREFEIPQQAASDLMEE